jgi:hypothetical protein
MIKRNGKKFTKEYKDFISNINNKEGFAAAYAAVLDEFPDTQKKTVRCWVDRDYKKRKQSISQRVYKKWKESNPTKYEALSTSRREQQRNKLKEDQDFRQRQYERTAKWVLENKSYHKDYSKNYWKQNKQKILNQKAHKRKNDVAHRMVENLRSYVRQLLLKAFKGSPTNKTESTSNLIGCTKTQLLQHLQQQYKHGMTDKNYGSWHIDHIIPCSSFDLTNIEERQKCFHYTNLQPLWAAENLAKGDKILQKIN